jgi:nicotinate-nucleotide--dimethylbenzimidazole phosphoribosyltransferase
MTDAEMQAHIDGLAKPKGSLGAVEALAVRLGVIQDTVAPRTTPRRIVLFAADHGVVAAGVTPWPQAVTGLMVETIAAGRAASSVLAVASGTDLRIVDVGTVSGPIGDPPAWYRDAAVQRGSGDLSTGPALSVAAFEAAWAVGAEEAARAADEGFVVVAAGEMGIGNTTPSACLAMLLADLSLDLAVGPGAGADDAMMAVKRSVVNAAVERARGEPDAQVAIASVGGLEIAAMAGFFAESEARGLTVVLDGFIATAAALVAERLRPGTVRAMIAAHVSAEPGHRAVLNALGLVPVLDFGMRLGEGSGALVALPLLDAAAAICGMARLADLGVGREDG